MSESHKGNSSAEAEAAPEKKSETESKTFPIAASIFPVAARRYFRVSFCFSALDDESPLRNFFFDDETRSRNFTEIKVFRKFRGFFFFFF